MESTLQKQCTFFVDKKELSCWAITIMSPCCGKDQWDHERGAAKSIIRNFIDPDNHLLDGDDVSLMEISIALWLWDERFLDSIDSSWYHQNSYYRR